MKLSLQSPDMYRTFSRIKTIFYHRFGGSFPADSVSMGVVLVTCQIFRKSTQDSSFQLIGRSSSLRTGVSLKGLIGKQMLNCLFSEVRHTN